MELPTKPSSASNVDLKDKKEFAKCQLCKEEFPANEMTFVDPDEYNPEGYHICHGCMPRYLRIMR